MSFKPKDLNSVEILPQGRRFLGLSQILLVEWAHSSQHAVLRLSQHGARHIRLGEQNLCATLDTHAGITSLTQLTSCVTLRRQAPPMLPLHPRTVSLRLATWRSCGEHS